MFSIALNSLRPWLAISLVVFLASCSCSNNAPLRDLEVPEVTSTTPSNNSKNAVINTFINVTFSEIMDDSSINTGSFVLLDSSGKRLDGTVSYSGVSATLKPSQILAKNSNYSVKLSRKIKDVAGNQIVEDYIWPFTTGTKSDDEGPTVKDVFPYEYSRDVPLNSNISITLSEAVSGSSVTADSFLVTDIDDNVVSGEFTIEDQKITFNPILDLDYDTKYTITLSTDIQDLAGNALQNEYITQFTTIKSTDLDPPLITSVFPQNGAGDVSLNSKIIISFSEDINSNSIDANTIVILDETGQAVTGSFEVTGSNVIFEPSLPFEKNMSYNIRVTSGVTDLIGNNLQAEFTWSFKTGSDIDILGPTITYVNPEPDAVDVAGNNAITATFSEEINPATLDKSTMTLVSNAERIDADITYSGNTAIFRPKAILANNTTYTATISAKIADLAGNEMQEPYQWVFTTGITPDRELPSVTSVYPENLASNVPINNVIVTRFSEAMDPTSINAETFLVTDPSGNQIIGSMKTIAASVTFRPLNSFEPLSNYTVTIKKEATDLATNAMEEDYTWTFTTSSDKDEINPTILSTVPASSSNFAPTNRGLIVTFSETMDLETINSSTFYLTDTSGTLIPGNINYAGDTITFMPNGNLDFSRSYIATISANVADMAGNSLELTHVWSFTTGTEVDNQAPNITFTIPATDARAIIDTSITINFDKEMDIVSLNTANIKLFDDTNNPVLGTIAVTSTSAIFTPVQSLVYNTPYSVIVTTGIRDLSRNHMINDYQWSFRTSLHPDEAPPFVVSVSPFDAQEKVKVTSSLVANFSEPLNCETLTASTFVLTSGVSTIPGTVSCDGSVATFTPNEVLSTDSAFSVVLTTSIQDSATTPMEEEYSWQFSTAPWTQQFGSVEADLGEAINVDSNGNVISTGTTSGNLATLNVGNTDIFVTKHSQNSVLLWSKQFGSTSEDYITDITSDPENNIYLSGYSYGDFDGSNNGSADIIVFKLDSNGNLIWKTQLGSAQDDIATALKLDNNGDLVLSGYSFASFDGNLSNGMHDIVVFKMSTDGTQIWSQQIGTLTSDIANDLVIDSANNIYITGYTQGDLSGSGSFGNADIFLSKLDSNSVLQWTQQIGTVLSDQAQSIATDSSGNLYITGFTFDALDNNAHLGSTDQFVLKYDNNGVLIWSSQIGSEEDDRAYGISIDNNDEILVTGYTFGDMHATNAGDFDLTLMKLDENATPIWSQQIGTELGDLSFDVTHDDNNNIYIIGRSQGSVDGNSNAGFDDAIIMKWDSNGNKQ